MKIGLISLPLFGHLNPFLAVARVLKARGHHPVYLGLPDCASAAQAAGIDFFPHSQEEFPLGSVAETWGPVAKMHGMEIVDYAFKINTKLLGAALKNLPHAIEQSGVEALIVDPIHFLVELVPMSLHLPFVHLCPVLHMDPTLTTPPSLFSWPFETTPEARERNLQALQQVGGYIASSAGPIAAVYAAKTGLTIDLRDPNATASQLAFITQCPKEFDFPGIPWPPTFHYAGSLVDDTGRAPIPFDWTRLDGRPLIYASLGTLVNGLLSIHRAILAAAARMPGCQIVFSIGYNVDANDLGPVPENVILVAAAPQIELLKRAVLCITHAGLNTTLESLAAGVPMVAIPIGYDQPGVAARIAYHGVGEFLEVEELSADALFHQLDRVLSTPSYREKANHFREILARTDGTKIAANVIEQAFSLSA